LTAGDEIVAVENLDILRSNGFEVEIDEDQIPGRGERIKLSAMPVSKETTFDFKGEFLLLSQSISSLMIDLEQLLHLLSDGSRPAGQMVRCTKARAMFAMRACRKSVMIGKTLTRNQMVALLRNMGTIDQPWVRPFEWVLLMRRTALMGDRLCDI
jgi:DNA mismatch repair protein PMS2